jgi:hypothetical protein
MSKISAVLGFCLAALLPAMAFAQGAAAPTVVTNPPGAPVNTTIFQGGANATVSLDGALSVNTQAYPQFADTFSTTLDTTTNWTAKNSTGTAATAAGQLVINSSTTASAWGGVSSQQTFSPVGIEPQIYGVLASFTVTAQANSVRVWGMFTVPATPTTAVPVTDGYIYRLDGTGALFAEIWSSGVAVSSTNVTASCLPLANIPAIFAISYRASLVQFICGTSTALPVALVPGINPVNQNVNVSALSIAGSTPPAASAVMNLSAIALSTLSPATTKSINQSPNINDPAVVQAISPVASISTGSLAANQIVSAVPANLYSFEVSADATLSAAAWWIMIYDAASAPVDGAVTPKKCFAQASGTTSYAAAFPTPVVFSTGITIGASTTGCFSKTASTHAFISGDAK